MNSKATHPAGRADRLDEQDARRTTDAIVKVAGTYIDPATGEVIGEQTPTTLIGIQGDVFVGRRKNRVMDEPFVMLTKPGAAAIAESGLSAMAMRVLMVVMSEVEYGNQVRLNLSKLARKWGTTRGRVRRGIQDLLAAHFLLQVEAREGSVAVYMLHPGIAWKGGKRQERKDALALAEASKPADNDEDAPEG